MKPPPLPRVSRETARCARRDARDLQRALGLSDAILPTITAVLTDGRPASGWLHWPSVAADFAALRAAGLFVEEAPIGPTRVANFDGDKMRRTARAYRATVAAFDPQEGGPA